MRGGVPFAPFRSEYIPFLPPADTHPPPGPDGRPFAQRPPHIELDDKRRSHTVSLSAKRSSRWKSSEQELAVVSQQWMNHGIAETERISRASQACINYGIHLVFPIFFTKMDNSGSPDFAWARRETIPWERSGSQASHAVPRTRAVCLGYEVEWFPDARTTQRRSWHPARNLADGSKRCAWICNREGDLAQRHDGPVQNSPLYSL